MKRTALLVSSGYALGTLLLYGFALRLPFFYDDLPITTWVNARSWVDVLRTPEAGYFRPLPYLIYKLGLLLPTGFQQPALHAANLALLYAGALLIREVVILLTGDRRHAAVAGMLYIAFPFLATTIPWITAMPHPLVTLLTLVAAYGALRAASTPKAAWVALSLAAAFLAPFAHESGAVAGLIVGSILLLRRIDKTRTALALAALVLTLVAIWIRPATPSASLLESMDLSGPYEKSAFFLQSLLYPLMPIVAWAVRALGWNDLVLVVLCGGAFGAAMVLLVRQDRTVRAWLVPALWWWAWASLPAALFFNFAALYIAPRLYTLSAVGCVVLWSGLIVTAGRHLGKSIIGPMLEAGLVLLVLVPGLAHISSQRALFVSLSKLYADVLEAVEDPRNAPAGLVNLPHNMAWELSPYPLMRDSVVFVPWYASIGDFVRVNREADLGDSEPVIFGPATTDGQPFLGVEGAWVEAEQMAAYAREHTTVWLTTRDTEGLPLHFREVGSLAPRQLTEPAPPLAEYTGGPKILSASAERIEPGAWKITLWWKSSGPLGAEIFVHVYDAHGELITQADGPALSGLVPVWTWLPEDLIRDVRYLVLPADAKAPYSVGVGLYTGEGRFPAYSQGQRCANDAAIVATIQP